MAPIIPGDLITATRERQVLPFIGSGVSAVLGLPNWRGLINQMGVQIGYDPEIFNVYGTLLELAEYFEARKGSLKPLAEWMDREWHKQLDRVDSSRVHQAIMNLDSPII